MAQIRMGEENTSSVQVPITEEGTSKELHQKGVTATIKALSNEKDPASAYLNAIKSNDRVEMMSTWNETTTRDRLNVIQQQLGYLPSDDVQSKLSSLDDNLRDDTSIQGNYIESVKGMPQTEFSSEDEVTREAVHMQLRETMSENTPDWSEMSYGDIASSIGGVLIPKRRGAGYTKLLSDMGFIDEFPEKAGAFINPTDEINKLRNMFWDLDDQGQIDFMQLLSEHLPNASDNPIIRGEIVHNILGADFNPAASTMFETLDNVDLGFASKAVFDLGRGFVRAGNALNVAKRLDAELAADVIMAANKNPEAATKVGVTQADIGDAVNPLVQGDVGTLLTGVPDDKAASISAMVDLQEARFKVIFENMARDGVIDEGLMTDAMRKAELDQMRMPGVIEANVNQFDETGFTLDWVEAYHDSIGRLRKRKGKKTVNFTVDDLGEVRAPVEEWVNKGVTTLDPNAKMTGSLRQMYVTTVESLARKQERTSQAFDFMMRDAFKGLDKSWSWKGYNARKAAQTVDHALMRGAKRGASYTYEQLVHGVTGRTMTHNEATAYIGVRNVVEKLYQLKNKQIVDNLLASNVKLYDGVEGTLPVRNYSTWQAAKTAWGQVAADSHHILVPDGGLVLRNVEMENGLIPFKGKAGLTKSMIQEAYDKGYILARNHSQSGLFKKGQIKTQWAFVKEKKVISPRGQQVINRIEGYIPKQRTGAYFWIKKSRNIGLSGSKDHRVLTTSAYSDTEEAAKKWIAQQEDPDSFKLVFDRELTAEQRMYDVASTHGGMYAGARKSTELPFVGVGDSEFADSFEALQHYINHIGRQYPASLYRIGAEARLIKMANDLGVTGKNLNLHNVLDIARAKGLDVNDRPYKMLKGVADQLSFVNMIPTESELAMSTKWKVLGSMLDKETLAKVPGWERVPKYFYQKAAKNAQPQDIIRGVTFNHLLGMYNPAQLIVQYSGALVSIAIDPNPINVAKHISKQLGWTVMDTYAYDPIAQKKMMGWFKKNGMWDYVGDDYLMWANSGFRETVVQGAADYVSVFTKNLPYDAGILRKVMAEHTMFYKMGELANTRMAYATALTRVKKIHGVDKLDHTDPKILEEVGMWTEKFRLNMSRANQSDLNKGITSPIFQFQQIISKYFEKVMPRWAGGTDELTAAEKLRLGIIPTVATGAVGIPGGEFVLNQLFDVFNIDRTELSEEQLRTAKHGIIGWTTMMGDLNVNFSERMTLGGDVLEAMFELITRGKATWQWMGASGNVADRYWRNMQYIHEAFDLVSAEPNEFTIDDLTAMPSILLEAASDIPTVTRNFKQYASHILTNNKRFIKDGKFMWDWETMNTRTAVLGAWGFQPSEGTDMYEIADALLDSSTSFATWGDTDSDVILRIMNTKLLTGKDVKDTAMYARIVNTMIAKYGPTEQQKLMVLIRDKTMKRKFDQDSLFYKTMLESTSRMQDDLNLFNALLARKRTERK